jgi:DNA-binding transcriptional MerR regulator
MAVEKRAPQGYVGTPEAARLLGVTQQTIRNRIRAGTLKGKEVRYPEGERRYYVEHPALDLELSRRGQVARYENIAEYSQTLADHFTRQAKLLRDTMEAQNAEYSRRLEDMEHNQREIAARLNEAVDILRESADREKRFQEDVLDLLARRLNLLG